MARRAGLAILIICTFAPAVGLTINVINPARHNYYGPQAALLIAGLFALYVARFSVVAGLGVYGILSLAGLHWMFCQHADAGGNWSTLVFMPSFGVLIVGCCIRSLTATVAQAGVVSLGNLLTGVVYGNLSGVFTLLLATSIMSIVAIQLCHDKNESLRQLGAIWARRKLAHYECDRLREQFMDGSD